MTITPEDLVRREVHYCVSSLVSTLAAQAGMSPNGNSHHVWSRAETALVVLCEQAIELAAPIDDWEEAAIQAGWTWFEEAGAFNHDNSDPWLIEGGDWRELCETVDIEPYQREVFEHWIVSDWLADKLEAKGEKVDKDFVGLTIWARTTTGQGIASDWVIEQICEELNQ